MAHYVRAFNTLYDEFINKLQGILPASTKISKYDTLRKVLQKANSRGPMDLFLKSVHPYSSHIFNREEEFFLGNQDLTTNSVVNETFADQLGLKSYWNALSETEQDAVWQYMEGLLRVGYRVYGIKWTPQLADQPFADIQG